MNRRQKEKQFKKKHGIKPDQIADLYAEEMRSSMQQITKAMDRLEGRIKNFK